MALTTSPTLRELHERGDHAGVLRLARGMDVQPAADPESTLIVAASLYRLDRFRECLQVCAVLEPVLRGQASFLHLHASALRRLGERPQAEELFRHALDLHPSHLGLRTDFGALLLECHRLEEAEAQLKQVLAQQGDHAGALAQLRQLEALRGRTLPPPSASAADAPPSPPTPGGALVPVPPPLPDPLLQAFSEQEVLIDQEARREHQAAKAQGAAAAIMEPGPESPSRPKLPELPPLGEEEALEEQMQATRAALVEDRPKVALLLADQLREEGGDLSVEAYRLAAEAYLRLGNEAAAELCLHAIAARDAMVDVDRVNLAALAARRHDLEAAHTHIARVQDGETYRDNLDTLRRKIEERESKPPLLLFTPEGLKPLRRKDKAAEPTPAKRP